MLIVYFLICLKELPGNITVGHQTLANRGFDFGGNLFWISVGALFGFTLVFNIGFTLALSYLKRKNSTEL